MKKRLAALMMAGLMVTSNVLPAYSGTEGTASSYQTEAEASEELTETEADVAADEETDAAAEKTEEAALPLLKRKRQRRRTP